MLFAHGIRIKCWTLCMLEKTLMTDLYTPDLKITVVSSKNICMLCSTEDVGNGLINT